jgi:ABC-2 type transport system permease protein
MFTIRPSHLRERRYSQPVLVQLVDLFLMELTNWRWSWRHMLLSGMVVPLFSIVALGVFARDGGREALVYVMTGNIVVSLLFGTMNSIQGHTEWLRFQGGFDYFATLPIRRYAFVLAMALTFLLFSLPPLVVTLCLGTLLLRVPIALSPLIVVVVPLCALPLAGLGAILGLVGRTRGESGSLTSLLTLLMIALGPVVIPPSRLPGFVLVLGHCSPATYAASALRQTTVGPVTGRILVDLVVLAGMTVSSLWLVGRKMNWHQE